MNRFLPAVVLLALAFAGSAYGQGQTASRDFAHSVSIDGVGKITISYKSFHWNPQAYDSAKKNDQIRERLNSGLWHRIGTFDTEMDLNIGGTVVPRGSYAMGINFGAKDDFKLVLVNGSKEMDVPLTTQADEPIVDYLTFDIRPSAGGDGFVVEGRYGKFRATAQMVLSSLVPTGKGD